MNNLFVNFNEKYENLFLFFLFYMRNEIWVNKFRTIKLINKTGND